MLEIQIGTRTSTHVYYLQVHTETVLVHGEIRTGSVHIISSNNSVQTELMPHKSCTTVCVRMPDIHTLVYVPLNLKYEGI